MAWRRAILAIVNVDVAFLPGLLQDPARHVCVVVDALRASTSLVTMVERGLAEAIISDDLDEARRLRGTLGPDVLLCGEVGGFPPEGFDYGNSPVEFQRLDLTGRRAVLFTTNGTAALARVADAAAVLVGALRNASAAAAAALLEARRLEADVAVVCAGNETGTLFNLEDAITAGAIVEACFRRAPSLAPDLTLEATDAAVAARRLYGSYDAGPLYGFRTSRHGRYTLSIGFAADVAFCAEPDRSTAVPRLHRRDGHLVVTAGP
ncbi:MAG TPA: 2-phosphosulfolactate phosphatase [Dehalococcoidia bacterium]